MKTQDQILLEQAYSKINENVSSFQSLIPELERGIPMPGVFTKLNTIKQAGDVNDLIRYLNELGDQDEQNWALKDNLIRILFRTFGLSNEEMQDLL